MGDAANPKREHNSPMLTRTNYTVWAMKMRAIFNVNGVWDMIDPGTAVDAKKNGVAIALLFESVPEEQVLQIGNLETAKAMWDAIKTRHRGVERVVEARVDTLMSEFESLSMKEGSTVDDFAAKITSIASKTSSLGTIIAEHRLVKRFLNGLPDKFIHMVASLEQTLDLKTISLDDIVGRIKAYEERIGLKLNSQATKKEQPGLS